MSASAPLENPYAPPHQDPRIHLAPSAKKTDAGFYFLGVSACVLTGSIVVAVVLQSVGIALLGCLAATFVALLGSLRGLVLFVMALVAKPGAAGPSAGMALATLLSNGVMACVGFFATFMATFGFARGRQLRQFGRIVLPPVVVDDQWITAPMTVDAEGATTQVREGLAAQWRDNGRTEHASVAAFARLSLDLISLGAPPALIAASNQDALDEIRHTELCFSLARSLDGKSESPGAFPAASKVRTLSSNRALALATLAVDSLVDGALHEGVSARVIAKLARRCTDESIRAVLKEIAADEGRHAAHGWDVVEWCLAEGGDGVADALRGALGAVPMAVDSGLPEAAKDGSWEAWGIHGSTLEAEEYAKARAGVVKRVSRMLDARRLQAA